MTAAAGPALFLDRDGVVNEDVGYLHRIEDCRFLPGVFEMTAAFSARGFRPVIVTNQSGIGRGLFSEADFTALMAWMRAEFARRGTPLAGVYHCPDHPTAGVGEYRRESPFRKPAPGMFLEAARELAIDLPASWCVGDRMSDLAAARAAGLRKLVLLAEGQSTGCSGDFWTVGALSEVAGLLAGNRRL